jgi:hypothetical protein
MSVQARLKVAKIVDFGIYQIATLHAVYSSDPADPNYSYSQATPDARMEMTISNPAAFGQFVPGKEYDLAFSPVVVAEVPDPVPFVPVTDTIVMTAAPTDPAPVPEPAASTDTVVVAAAPAVAEAADTATTVVAASTDAQAQVAPAEPVAS